MEAPDKIYIPNELLSEEWCRHIEGQDTEYIRKEALLEWANKELKDNVGQYHNDYDLALSSLIDKLNEM